MIIINDHDHDDVGVFDEDCFLFLGEQAGESSYSGTMSQATLFYE